MIGVSLFQHMHLTLWLAYIYSFAATSADAACVVLAIVLL